MSQMWQFLTLHYPGYMESITVCPRGSWIPSSNVQSFDNWKIASEPHLPETKQLWSVINYQSACKS